MAVFILLDSKRESERALIALRENPFHTWQGRPLSVPQMSKSITDTGQCIINSNHYGLSSWIIRLRVLIVPSVISMDITAILSFACQWYCTFDDGFQEFLEGWVNNFPCNVLERRSYETWWEMSEVANIRVSQTLVMKIAVSKEAMVHLYPKTRRHIPEDCNTWSKPNSV